MNAPPSVKEAYTRDLKKRLEALVARSDKESNYNPTSNPRLFKNPEHTFKQIKARRAKKKMGDRSRAINRGKGE